jgi:hypothetical protein
MERKAVEVIKPGNSFAALAEEKSKQTANVAIETSRAIREVEAALIVARGRPRDETEAWKNIMRSCQRTSFAERAIYRYSRGKEKVEGPSIRLLEACARAYGNINYGWREIERNAHKSTIEAYCWDLESNTRKSMHFEVNHYRDTKEHGRKLLETERDIYELVANFAARRVRACIEACIPADIIEDAKNEVKRVLLEGASGTDRLEQAKQIVLKFEEIGVTHDQLKRYLGVEKVVGATPPQVVELRQIYTAIRDGQATVREFFGDKSVVDQQNSGTEALLSSLLDSDPKSE